MVDEQKIKEILERGVEDVIVKDHLEAALKSGKKLRVKFGIDPTSPDLHLGHAVVLRKLKAFQELGHTIVLIIGDFTATIGDPTGKSKTRPPLTTEEVGRNMRDYLDHAGKIIDVQKAEVCYNSEWLEKLGGAKILQLLSLVSVNQILERNDFAKRLREQQSIRAHELLYPVMQAYDSVVVEADCECGGTDQTFNMLMGRMLMERMGLAPQDVMTVPIIEGTDGKEKMSKSLGNYIGISDTSGDMFGKIMSISDSLILKYFWLCTDVSQDELDAYQKRMEKGANPKDIKMELGKTIVALYHTKEAADTAADEWEKKFSKKESVVEAREFASKGGPLKTILVESGLAESGSAAVRLVEGKSVLVNAAVETDWKTEVKTGDIIQAGKKKETIVIING